MLTIPMLKRNHRHRRRFDQSGVVSLIVVSILTVVIALVAVGFSKLMDREVRRSLDNELSAQAYYSALAGLNDARAYLADCQTGSVNPSCGFSGCKNWPSLGNSYFVSDLSGGQNLAKYSCIGINTTPNELIYTINPGQSVTFAVSQPSMAKMYFGWEKTSYQTAPQPLGPFTSLPQQTALATDATGLLRVGLYPIPNGNNPTTNAALTNLSRTYFLYPDASSTAGQVGTTSPSSNGDFVHGYCHANNTNPVSNTEAAGRYCNSVITGLNGGAYAYYVHLTAEYTPLIVTIQTTTNGNNADIPFSNVQAVVDVTGQGTDVLQRIRARIDLSSAYETPDYGIQSMLAVCKGYEINVPSQGQYGGSTVDTYNGDNACAIPGYGGSITTSPGDLPPHNGLPGPAPPPSFTVAATSGSWFYNVNRSNEQLNVNYTINDINTPNTTAWVHFVECNANSPSNAVAASNNTQSLSITWFPIGPYYCAGGPYRTGHFEVCASAPSVSTQCSAPIAVTYSG